MNDADILHEQSRNPPNPPLLKEGEGGISAPLKNRVAGLLILAAMAMAALPSSTIIAQPQSGSTTEQGISVIVHTAKPYKKLIASIEDLGGTVTIQYQNVDAVAVRLPVAGLGLLRALPGVKRIEKDRIVELPKLQENYLKPRLLAVQPSQSPIPAAMGCLWTSPLTWWRNPCNQASRLRSLPTYTYFIIPNQYLLN